LITGRRCVSWMSLTRHVERIDYVPDIYTATDETNATLAWDSVLPGYGSVAVDAKYVIRLEGSNWLASLRP